MKVKLSIPCEFTDEQVESAVMAMLKHQPMTNGELLRKFTVQCWDVVNDALTRLLSEKKVREIERLDGLYLFRTDYQEWVTCAEPDRTLEQPIVRMCSNINDIENPLYESEVKRCAACGKQI